jgi:N-acetylglucosamine malate deacetylase 2
VAGELVSRSESCLIVAPHPDDETIGAGIWMERHRDMRTTLVHVTDGSPRDLSAARAARLQSRKAYAERRRQELHAALSLVGISSRQLRKFSYVDKESYLHLPEIIARMVALLENLKPTLVLSPAYEGGHPDHDSAAFAVASARLRVSRPFRHVEYRLYHADTSGTMTTEDFLPETSHAVEVYRLSPAEQQKKEMMLASFATQQHVLKEFRVCDERFREAPAYDFSRPPHQGTLLYESWGWGISGADWRHHALRAERELPSHQSV